MSRQQPQSFRISDCQYPHIGWALMFTPQWNAWLQPNREMPEIMCEISAAPLLCLHRFKNQAFIKRLLYSVSPLITYVPYEGQRVCKYKKIQKLPFFKKKKQQWCINLFISVSYFLFDFYLTWFKWGHQRTYPPYDCFIQVYWQNLKN